MTQDAERKEPEIEKHYQIRAKQLVDTLFDLGLLSQSLSRDGIEGIEGLLALYLQQTGDSAARCAGFTKKYKVLGGRLKKDDDDTRQRHEEEMAWIARAKEAEALCDKLYSQRKMDKDWKFAVVGFLRTCFGLTEQEQIRDVAADLLRGAFDIGIAEPDLGPGEIGGTD